MRLWRRLCGAPLVEELACRLRRRHTGMHDDLEGHVWEVWP